MGATAKTNKANVSFMEKLRDRMSAPVLNHTLREIAHFRCEQSGTCQDRTAVGGGVRPSAAEFHGL